MSPKYHNLFTILRTTIKGDMVMTEPLTSSKALQDVNILYIKLLPVDQRKPNLNPHANFPPLIRFLSEMLK